MWAYLSSCECACATCTCVRVRVRGHFCLACLHVCMQVSACMPACMSICLHVCLHACPHVCPHVCLRVCRVRAHGSEEAKPTAMMSAPAQSCQTLWLESSAKATKHSDESSISEPSAGEGGEGRAWRALGLTVGCG